MPVGPLFSRYPLFDFIESRKQRARRLYEGLSASDALDEDAVDNLRRSLLIQTPRLDADSVRYEEGISNSPSSRRFVASVAFRGDPLAFQILPICATPSIEGEIVGSELRLTLDVDDSAQVDESVRLELAKVLDALHRVAAHNQTVSRKLSFVLGQLLANRRRLANGVTASPSDSPPRSTNDNRAAAAISPSKVKNEA